MKRMVLCISRKALQEQGIPEITTGIYDFDLYKVSTEDYHFINRKVVDSKDEELYIMIGFELPQILPYMVISDGQGKYLSYSRNGTETRLHGSRSIGIGGHIDITDINDKLDIMDLIYTATHRELVEETNLHKNLDWTMYKVRFNRLIVDTSNEVGIVHVGLFATLVYPDANPQEELHDPKWLTVDELKASIDEYENWSKIIIKELV